MKQDNKLNHLLLLKRIINQKRFRGLFFTIIIVTVIGSLFAGVGIGLFIPVIEILSRNEISNVRDGLAGALVRVLKFFHLKPTLLTIISVIFLSIFFQAILEFTRKILAARLRDDATKYLRDNSFANLMDVSLTYYHRNKVGVLTSILGDEAYRGGLALQSLSDIFASAMISVIYIGILIFISWQITFFAILLAILSTFFIKKLLLKSEWLGQEKGSYKNLITNFCFENLSSYLLINIFNYQEAIKKYFYHLTSDIKNNLKRLSRHNASIVFLNTMLRVIAVCALIYILYEVMHLSIGYLATVLLIISQLAPKINEINVFTQGFLENISGLRSIYELTLRQDKPYIINGARKITLFNDKILFKGASFSYVKEIPVLQNINFTIEKGSTTAIIGASGSGKSTLVALIPRFYDVSSGQITIDGINLKEIDVFTWRNLIGFISQETFIYNDTLRNNLLIAKVNARDEELMQAIELAHLDDLIKTFPKGLEITLGDRGLKLSGGQKQRIAIARVFLKNPEILIFDEATSALDNISERFIQQSLDELSQNKTVIVIAHRLSTIKNADKIIVLEQGRIVEEGNHNTLTSSASYYQRYLTAVETEKI